MHLVRGLHSMGRTVIHPNPTNMRPILLLLVGLVLVPGVAFAQEPQPSPSPPALTDESIPHLVGRAGEQYTGLADRIDSAMARGAEWLLEQQTDDGSWQQNDYPLGDTALAGMALRKVADHTVDDALRRRCLAAVDKALQFLRSQPVKLEPAGQWHVCSLGIVLMLLEAHHTVREPLADGSGVRLRVDITGVSPSEREWISSMVQVLTTGPEAPRINPAKPDASPPVAWRMKGLSEKKANVFNTHIAVMALQSAGRLGVKLPDPGLWRNVARCLVESQEDADDDVQPDAVPRSWSFQLGRSRAACGAMTAAALASLRVVQAHLPPAATAAEDDPLRKRIAAALRDGTAWLSQHVDATLTDRGPTRERSGGDWRWYQVSMIEAAGSTLQRDQFGDTWWYAAGARVLCDGQTKDGTWLVRTRGRAEIDTSHALMFLARATTPPTAADPGTDGAEVTPGGSKEPGDPGDSK